MKWSELRQKYSCYAVFNSALDWLQKDLFQCIVLRKFASCESSQPFPGLQSLVDCIRQQTADKEMSSVTYTCMEIVSERDDSKLTLMGIISQLQAEFVQKLRQKCVLVVGDKKSIFYKPYVMNIRAMLIPFPGDWHIRTLLGEPHTSHWS